MLLHWTVARNWEHVEYRRKTFKQVLRADWKLSALLEPYSADFDRICDHLYQHYYALDRKRLLHDLVSEKRRCAHIKEEIKHFGCSLEALKIDALFSTPGIRSVQISDEEVSNHDYFELLSFFRQRTSSYLQTIMDDRRYFVEHWSNDRDIHLVFLAAYFEGRLERTNYRAILEFLNVAAKAWEVKNVLTEEGSIRKRIARFRACKPRIYSMIFELSKIIDNWACA